MHVTSRPPNEVRIRDQSQSLALRQKDICLNFGLKMLRWCDRRPVFFGRGAVNTMLAVLAGVITVVPLPLYHAGNRDLPIMVAGLLFYANPTTQMLIGIYHFQVPFQPSEAVTFGLIWCGLALYFLSRRPNGQAA